jgi:two-component system CheB/CheR fusion protein
MPRERSEPNSADTNGHKSPVIVTDPISDPAKSTGPLVVGIGASAGGIQALQTFFKNVPRHSGIAYVVILHLSPDHDSKLAEVLQHTTEMPVKQVTEKIKVEPDHVYVVPPNKTLRMLDSSIEVLPIAGFEERRAPVDMFFRTLAESHESRAVAVVLSGTGANGSMGIKRVKERGGAAFVQNPREAEFNEMPRNSIATELIDAVLPVAEIPKRIVEYQHSLGSMQVPLELSERRDEQQQALREIFSQLRLRTGHDFSNYKQATVLRRIERRIGVRALADLPTYAAYLKDDPQEPQALLKDLLISVTNFFRDKKAWEYLEKELIPKIIAGKDPDDSIRVWIVGCATGEEAYSIAMILSDQTLGMMGSPSVQIFATDIDAQAINFAREGLYTLNDAADVPPDKLRKFFTKEGESYRIRREIREMILFANHNVIKEPPFSHLDLVSCRNVLIYLNNVAQERVMETLHFALNPGGYLFVGSSESADGSSDRYAPVNKDFHIFQSRQVAARSYPVPEAVPSFRLEPQPIDMSKTGKPALERITYGDLHQQLLEQYAPPSVVVNQEYDILHLSERAGDYLQVSGGEPSNNLLKLVNPDLRLELRTALLQAVQRATNVEIKNVQVSIGGQIRKINLLVRPVLREADTSRGFILVIFEPAAEDQQAEPSYSSPEPIARQLEEELMRSKSQLRASLEQAEVQTEELRASNEELQAMNEELRSAAEELETSKEELQSINEELITVNQELKVKIDELSQSNNNFQNLINSTDIATVFLDRGLRVILFSPATRAIFNLLPTDVGRPLTDITNKLQKDGLVEDAEKVLHDLQTVEREVRTTEGCVYMMRVLPYRTSEDHISGVVITFFDITERIHAEEHYRELFSSIEEGFCIVEVLFDKDERATDYRFVEANPAFESQTGLRGVAGKTAKQVLPKLDKDSLETLGTVVQNGEPARFESYDGADGQPSFEVYAYRYGIPANCQVAMLRKALSKDQ